MNHAFTQSRQEVIRAKRRITELEDALTEMAEQEPHAAPAGAWFIIKARRALGRDINGQSKLIEDGI